MSQPQSINLKLVIYINSSVVPAPGATPLPLPGPATISKSWNPVQPLYRSTGYLWLYSQSNSATYYTWGAPVMSIDPSRWAPGSLIVEIWDMNPGLTPDTAAQEVMNQVAIVLSTSSRQNLSDIFSSGVWWPIGSQTQISSLPENNYPPANPRALLLKNTACPASIRGSYGTSYSTVQVNQNSGVWQVLSLTFKTPLPSVPVDLEVATYVQMQVNAGSQATTTSSVTTPGSQPLAFINDPEMIIETN